MPNYPLTWVVVADSGRCRIFSLAANNADLEELEGAVNPAARLHEGDITGDRPGMAFDGKGRGRHAMPSKHSAKGHAEEAFANSLAATLNDAQLGGRYERLVLFAPPHFLGVLRSQLDPAVANRVKASVDGDVTKQSPAQIRERLRKLL